MDIQLYDFKPTRSQRCRWTFLEAGIDYQTIDGENLFGTILGDRHHRELYRELGKRPGSSR